ncbi:MAG: penicillin-binding protein 2 [Tissierellia bacterium]|nr:penicillin-binding protein 2 [Tissierellia bacterium]
MEKNKKVKTRILAFNILSIIVFFSLMGRLYFIQIYNNEKLTLESLKQRSVEVSLSSSRGPIYDRNLIPLTNRERIKTLIGQRDIIINNKDLLELIINNTSLSKRELQDILNTNNKLVKIPLNKDIDIPDMNNIFIMDIINRYSKDNILSHVIGYINRAENRGETGIEKVYDEFLRNSDKEYFFVEYDKNRSLILGGSYYVDNTITSEEPAGVKLTIDYRIQKIVEEILDQVDENGAVVVADIESGEILALASRPSFNQENIEDYLNRTDMSLYNKAIQVSYPPGSIFKIVVTLAALEENMDFLERDFYCKGYEKINNVIINCNNKNGHGHIDLKEGFAKSCNSIFIQIGKEIGAKKIIDMAERLGFGNKINIGLLEEVEGSLHQGEELLGPAIGNISIGQDKIQATPLQITNMLVTIANDGIEKDMTIVQGITTKDGIMIKPYYKEEDRRIISRQSALILQDLLKEVLNSGTASSLDLEEIGGGAGKTGSAEGSLGGRPTIHGWFAGYFPRDNPKYAITVLVEEASSGSKSAAPIFERICKKIFLEFH